MIRAKLLLLFLFVSNSVFCQDVPKGWFVAGSDPDSYTMSVDKGSGQNGKNAATIKSTEKKIKGFGTLMQDCLPDQYLGKRVKFSAMIKTENVSDWAGLWLRLDEKLTNDCLGFDNMKNGKADRSIKGTTEWTNYEIVLDVPEEVGNMAFGALLSGTGQIWFDELKMEIVDSTVPVTGLDENLDHVNASPINLDFEE
jgi:hypothetical protein